MRSLHLLGLSALFLLIVAGCQPKPPPLLLKTGAESTVTIIVTVDLERANVRFAESWLEGKRKDFPDAGFVIDDYTQTNDLAIFYFRGTIHGPLDIEEWTGKMDAKVRSYRGVWDVNFSNRYHH